MNLDEAQRQQVTAWIAEGLKLSEIQSRLASELGVRVTYMEVRLLVDDLKLTPKDAERPQPAELAAAPADAGASPPAEAKPTTGGVSVSVAKIARPGAIVSGQVTFSDGQQAEWHLDQTGRLGVVPKQQGYKPPPADVQQFQLALEREMAKMGY
jgi:hypothetical protein